jgi:peptidoglycan-associated lipoprotein
MHRSAAILFVSIVALAGTLAGCGKRPSTTQAAAPPPPAEVRPRLEPTPPAGATPSGPSIASRPSMPATVPPAQPAPPRPALADFVSVPDLRDVYFDFDKYDIRPSETDALETNARWLRKNDRHLVLIEGHADERGTNEYNLALGERRAKATLDYLVSRGITRARITILSLGEERPACTERAEWCWSKNRRAHFLVKPR